MEEEGASLYLLEEVVVAVALLSRLEGVVVVCLIQPLGEEEVVETMNSRHLEETVEIEWVVDQQKHSTPTEP